MDTVKLTKAEMIDAVWQRTGLEKQDIRSCYDELINVLKTALSSQRDVELRGFGSFEVRVRKGRANARNPKTGEQVTTAPHGVCVFRPGRDLKLAVWRLDEPDGSAV
jgi:integration host factor subunit beta